MMDKKQIKYLKSLTHDLDSIIWVGQHGLTDNVLQEINNALDHHELIKIKIRVGDRNLRDFTVNEITRLTSSRIIQKIGNVIVLFRRNENDPKINLPDRNPTA